ncbi:MAG TPA: ABC transporter substrate-binding protein [Puia sp.]|nr:ABC transporter substrate-binding protein [Puia sp.]
MIKHLFTVTTMVLTAVLAGQAQQRIVSLNGNISEMLCALGLEQQIAGVDVTSTYPASLQAKPKVGHNRNISAEGVMSLQPTLVLGLNDQLNPALQEQLQSAKVPVKIFKQDLSIAGVRDLLDQVAAATGTTAKAAVLRQQFDKEMAGLAIKPLDKKILFIYARGAGTLMVSGTGTSVDKVIQLAGAKNAIDGFTDFKPLTAESLAAADPDIILMFDSGLKSLGGIDGLLKAPGVAQTKAGRNRKVITMDGELLSGFGLRLPQAIKELQSKIN